MFSLLRTYFWWIDLAIALSVTTVVVVRSRATARGRFVGRLFWLGVAIGLTWEVPIFLSAIFANTPVLTFLRPPPLHPLVFMVAHALWDGGLFLAGAAIVFAVGPRPIFRSFRWGELAILTLWGQLSELAVEIGGSTNDAWVYVADKPWNPVLFYVGGHPITLVPQLIWLAAPLVFYLLAIRTDKSLLSEANRQPSPRQP